jgi:purine-nucleoside phosphorylase
MQFCTPLGLNHEYAVGDIVVINDHLFLAGLAGNHPLRGPNLDIFGSRFPPLSDAYDLSLRRAAHVAWKKGQADGKEVKRRRLHEGVYAFVAGPSFETRAECRMLRMLGADLVGMSTVPEIVVARHCGLRVLALSLVTNNAVLDPGPRGDDPLLEGTTADAMRMIVERGRANHEEVVEESHLAALDLQVKTACLLVVGQVIERS